MIISDRNMRGWNVYGYILKAYDKGKYEITQKEIALNLKCSLNTVNYSLKPLMRMGAIEKHNRGFRVIDAIKIMIHMANVYNISWESMYVRAPVEDIESGMPPGLYTAFSGAKIYYGIEPADYDKVFFFGNCDEVFRRFGGKTFKDDVLIKNNVFCSMTPPYLKNEDKTPLFQIYVDLWNLPYWYSREFLNKVYEEIEKRWI